MGREVVSLRKLVIAAALIVALAVPVAAIAATLKNGSNQTCGDGFVGTFHFVNNQTGKNAPPGLLTVIFTDGTQAGVPPDKVNQSVQQWDVQSQGTLVDASTTLPGNLVLSDFTCTAIKKK
jgi:hypothetical protein